MKPRMPATRVGWAVRLNWFMEMRTIIGGRPTWRFVTMKRLQAMCHWFSRVGPIVHVLESLEVVVSQCAGDTRVMMTSVKGVEILERRLSEND